MVSQRASTFDPVATKALTALICVWMLACKPIVAMADLSACVVSTPATRSYRAGVTISAGDWVYADKDGVLVSPDALA